MWTKTAAYSINN